MANEDITNLLKAGIQEAKSGNKAEARRLLEQVLEKDDSNEAAWMWLASVTDAPREKRICLENVLDINPNNQRARDALARLGPAPSGSAPGSARRAPSKPTEPARVEPPLPYSAAVHTKPGAERAQARRPRRRTNPVLLLGGGILAIALIGLGLFLLTNTGSAPQPAPTQPAVDAAGSPVATNLGAPTVPPAGTVVAFATDATALVKTWTPVPTLLPPTAVPTIVLPPLSSYTLAFVADGHPTSAKVIFQATGDGKDAKVFIGGSVPASDPAWSSKGQIAYVSNDDKQQQQIFVARQDGSGAKAITKFGDTYLATPSWSPDGTKLAFMTNQPGNGEIFVVDADGSNLTRLTDNTVEDRDPTWSPDGQTLVYASDISGKQSFQLLSMSLDTKKVTQITDSNGSNYNPSFSPDGKYLAFVSTRDRFPNVYVLNTQNVHEISLVSFGGGSSSNIDPGWSPDSLYIAFASNRDGKGYTLYAATRDGSHLQKLTESTGKGDNMYSPRFRPGP